MFVKFVVCFFLVHLIDAEERFMMTKMNQKPLWNSTDTDKLRHDLLLNYDRFARPAELSELITVEFGLTIRHVEINELRNMLTVNCEMKMSWLDRKLQWNSTDYGNMSFIHMAEHEIWQPDIMLYNSAMYPTSSNFFNTHILVGSDGTVHWVPGTRLSVFCDFNFQYWPFDTQTCVLIFGSWTYHGEVVDLQLHSKQPADVGLVIQNADWKLDKVTFFRNNTFYKCCTEPYPSLIFNMTLTRISHSYKAIIITPAFATMFIILMTFCLPPQASEKLFLQCCVSIIITMFLMYFTSKLTNMGYNTPLIVSFYSTSLYIVCFSLISSIAVIRITRSKHTYNLPWMIKQPLMGWLGKVLGLRNSHRISAKESNDQHVEVEDHQMIGESSAIQDDWMLFAVAIDRLSLIFYSLVFVVLTLVYSL